MSVNNFDELHEHLYHNVVVVGYSKTGVAEDIRNVAIECLDCCEILIDFDRDKNYCECGDEICPDCGGCECNCEEESDG